MTRSVPCAAVLFTLCATQVLSQSPSELLTVAGQPASSFGQSVDRAGDVNGDGYDDVIVGGTFLEVQGVRTGGAMVISGADGSVLHRVFGASLGACASFLYNLRHGIDDIRSGRARVAFIGAAEAPITPEIMEGYSAMGALATVKGLRQLDGLLGRVDGGDGVVDEVMAQPGQGAVEGESQQLGRLHP